MTPKPGGSRAESAGRNTVLVDTGFLVSLIDSRQAAHASAVSWLRGHTAGLRSVPSVLVETAHFLPTRLRPGLARLVASGPLEIVAPDKHAYGRVAELFVKYADLDPDWADLELVWLAEHGGTTRIATLDTSDFDVYRIHGRRRFDIVWPRR